MGKENITIKDIARELGISPSTVSRALKDHPDISKATRDAVNELAERWNYRPNPIALVIKDHRSYDTRRGTFFLLDSDQRH
jgi:LacI family transcriptional regulator